MICETDIEGVSVCPETCDKFSSQRIRSLEIVFVFAQVLIIKGETRLMEQGGQKVAHRKVLPREGDIIFTLDLAGNKFPYFVCSIVLGHDIVEN